MMSMRYEPRLKENGDVEIWRTIPESEWPEELIATFHEYGKGYKGIALVNAQAFCDEQNKREELLHEVVSKMHDI